MTHVLIFALCFSKWKIIGVGETLVGHPLAMTADLKKILMRLPADSIVSVTHP